MNVLQHHDIFHSCNPPGKGTDRFRTNQARVYTETGA